MSLHKSLRSKGKHTRSRNVLSREERILRLQKEERWTEDRSVFGLPKVKVKFKAPRRRAKEEAEAAPAAEAPAAETTPAAEPDEKGKGRSREKK